MKSTLSGHVPSNAGKDAADKYFLHHRGFVNHCFADFLCAQDPEVRKRHAETVKKMSSGASPAQDPSRMTAYERYWYEEREKVIAALEGRSDPSSVTSTTGFASHQQQSSSHGGCASASVRPPGGQHQQQPQLASPTSARGTANNHQSQNSRAGTAAANNTSCNNSCNHNCLSTSRSLSRTAVPGTTFEPLHPSHLYLHHHDLCNHSMERLLNLPPGAEDKALSIIRQSQEKSPHRGTTTTTTVTSASSSSPSSQLTNYEAWYYTERERVAAHLEERKRLREESRK